MRDAAVVDTNVLVYRYDYRFPDKQARATEVLRHGVERGYAIPHQALLEFVSVVSRPLPPNGERLLEWDAVVREAEDLMLQFDVLLPDADVFRTALRGKLAYQMSWFDAHLWAFAERFDYPVLLSEDFQHRRFYGRVQAVNPFL